MPEPPKRQPPKRQRYENQLVRISDLVIRDDIVEDAEFENCKLVGPAVVSFTDSSLNTGVFEGDLDELLWPPIPEGISRLEGAVMFRNCSFHRCNFERVGLIGSEKAIAFLRATLGGGDR